MKLDLVVHRTKLHFLRNRFLYLWGYILFIGVFISTFTILSWLGVKDATQQIIDGQKGEACIRLLPFKERTPDTVTKCIENNSTKPSKFKFNTNDSDDRSKQDSSITVKPDPTKELPMITVDDPIPSPPKQPEVLKPALKPVVESVTKPAVKIEKRINDITGILQCRPVGTLSWQEGNCK